MPRSIRAIYNKSLIPNAHSAIFRHMRDVILVLDRDNRIIDCNIAAENLINRPRSSYIGKKARDLLDYVSITIEQADTYTEIRLHQPDGTRYFDLNFFPMYHRQKLVGRIITLHDITHLKEVEAKTKQYLEELKIVNEELQAFDHTVAHDLKTPLTAIMGYVELVMQYEQSLSEQGNGYLENIRKSINKMTQMISDLLLLSRVGHTDAKIVPLDMNSILNSALDRFYTLLQTTTIQVDIPPYLPSALGHALWVEEIFANLISNAIKYIGKNNPAPFITISAIVEEGMARYQIRDNGLGIASHHQSQLFDLFTRFHKDEAEGVGLGLSIVARIVKRLGGEVGIDSTLGAGSTFWFTLPAAP